jgi:UDP-glucose 4-epimerase
MVSVARCLVVGGNGFLGSWVVDELVARGHDVSVFDRFSGEDNYASVGVRRIIGDFLDTETLISAVGGQQHVFHFLSTTSPATAVADPSLDVRSNVLQSIALFEASVASGVERVHFASTGGAMYGDIAGVRIGEDVIPAPVSPYAIGKLAIEGYLRFFERTRGLSSISYRISNPYGPRQHPGRKQGVIPIFLARIAQGLPLEVFGDGSSVRDYIYASDAARLVVQAMDAPTRHSVYNIGSGVGSTLGEVIELASELTARAIVVERKERPPTFVDRIVLDTSRYAAEFEVGELVSLRQGIETTWEHTARVQL